MKKVKEQKEEREPKETDCYNPSCRKKGKNKFGKTTEHFLLCDEHYDLAIFMRDMHDYFIENL